jgi:hypothetical protein
MALFQLHPDSPKSKAMVEQLKLVPDFVDRMVQQGNAMGTTMLETLRAIPGKHQGQVITDEALPKLVRNASKSLREAEGKAVQKFKDRVKVKFGNQKMPPSEAVNESGQGLLKELGFSSGKDGVLKPPTNEMIQSKLGTLGITDPGQYKSFVNTLNIAYQNGRKGFTPKGLETSINAVGAMNKMADRVGGPISSQWGAFTDTLRTQRRDMFKAAYDTPLEKELVDSTLDKFSSLATGMSDMGTALRGTASKKAFINQVFAKGQKGLPMLEAAQSMLKDSHPGTWREVKAEYIEQAIAQYSDKATRTQFNSEGLGNIFKPNHSSSLGKEGLEILFDDSGVTQQFVRDITTVSRQIEKTAFGTMSDKKFEELSKSMGKSLAGFRPEMVNTLYNVLTLGGTKRDMVKQLSKKGIDKIINAVPKANKELVSKTLNATLAKARMTGLLAETVAHPVRETIQRGGLGAVRSDIEEHF